MPPSLALSIFDFPGIFCESFSTLRKGWACIPSFRKKASHVFTKVSKSREIPRWHSRCAWRSAETLKRKRKKCLGLQRGAGCKVCFTGGSAE
jgi:hypothetical protein